MREILFRGKRKDNREWVYGYYVCLNEKTHRIYTGYAETDCGSYYPDFYEILPETIGQYTGLTDKNGKKIFEGDMVQHDFGADQIGVQYAVVEYDTKYASFMIKPIYDWMFCDKNDCEVIGNIHDNPKLLKEREG